MIASDAERVLTFWFGVGTDPASTLKEKSALWWGKGDETDRAIREAFGELRENAKAGALDAWADEATGRLALVILLDQCSRNLFRSSPEAFATDDRALALTLEGIDRGHDRELSLVQRTFIYMPLEHAEDREMQRRSVELFEGMAVEAPPELREAFDSFAKYARAHRDIIERFGRFPHRNITLGRESTPDELEFLKQPGSSF
jgi:uncharacterized protein (DUF924 family)